MTSSSRPTAGAGRFDLLARLGVGGFGEVWEAIDHARGERVAVKRLWNVSADALLGFKREFRTRQDVEHPNLVHAGELVKEGDAWWLTMELVRGRPWLEHVQGDPARIARTGRDLVGALVALHDHGLVHCDVKPSNVLVELVEEDVRVVLLDLGLVRRIDAGSGDDRGKLSGTAAYVAPELVTGDPISPASDFYSLGASLYEALTGQVPFVGTRLQLVYKKRFELPRPPVELVPAIPAPLSDLCMDLLRPRPDDRPDARNVAERLARIAGEDPEAAPLRLRAFPSQHMPFVGRRAELASMRRALAAMQTGSFAFVHVGSESGGGKTSLVRRFLAELADDALLVLGGRCFERELVPYNAFDGAIDALADAFTVLGPEETAHMIPPRSKLLARAFPVLTRVPGFALGAHSEVPSSIGREDVLDALSELFAKVAERRRVVLFLDDLQWADAESLAVLERVFARTAAPPLLLVAASRPSKALDPVVSNTIVHIAEKASHVERIALGPLAQEAAEELALAVSDHRLPRETLARVVIAAQGQPLFVAELAELLGRDAAMVPSVSVEEAIAVRARTLDPIDRLIVELLALIAGPLAQGVLAAATELEFSELSRRLVALRAARFIRTDRVEDSLRVEIFHDRVRAAVLGDVHADDRPALQRRLAVAMRANGISGSVDLAYLFLEAGESHEAAKELALAAERASGSHAFARAARLYFEALCLPGHRTDDEERAMWISLAEAYGNGGEALLSARAFAQASSLAHDEDEKASLELRAARNFLRSGHGLEGRGLVLRQLARCGFSGGVMAADRDPRVALGILLALAPPSTFSDLPTGAALASDALTLARGVGDDAQLVEALAYQAIVETLRGGDERAAAALLEEARGVVARPDDTRRTAVLAMATGLVEACWGRLDDARRTLDTAIVLFEERVVDSAFESATARFGWLLAALLSGELERARKQLVPWAHDIEQRGDLYGAVLLHVGVGTIGPLLEDDPDEAERIVDLTMARHRTDGFDLTSLVESWARLLIAVYRGDVDPLAQVERVLAPMRSSAWERFALARTAADVALSVAALVQLERDPEGSEHPAQVARASASALLLEGPFGRAIGEVVLAGLCARGHDVPRAEAHLRSAREALAPTDHRIARAFVESRLAALLDGPEASHLLGDAYDLFLHQGARNPARWLRAFTSSALIRHENAS